MSTSSRIVKNTGLLYLRMAITVFINLFSVRLILSSLGEEDFGIFNVIGGSIAMLGFLNSTLANATQRYMSYAEGKGDLLQKLKVFNVSIGLHAMIALTTVIVLFAVMPLFFNGILTIPEQRIGSAKIVYYSLLVSTFLTIINVPYDSILNAHENMFYYFMIGLTESFLKLIVAFICVYSHGDKLIIYALLMVCISIITFIIMRTYCHRKYQECKLSLRRYWENKLLKDISKYCGWNFLTAISSLVTWQGLSVVLNHYFGALLNAAQGIANQVNAQLSAFSINMMKAVNPVIVKKIANNDHQFSTVIFSSAKLSVFLFLMLAVPVTIKIPYILNLWLVEAPKWSVVFCRLLMINTVICMLTDPLATAIYGNGDIKKYTIYKSITNIIPLLLTILAFNMGGSPEWLYIPLLFIYGIAGNLIVMRYAETKCGISAVGFIKHVILPILCTTAVMALFGLLSIAIVRSDNLLSLILCGIFTTSALFLSLRLFALNDTEKGAISVILSNVKTKIRH